MVWTRPDLRPQRRKAELNRGLPAYWLTKVFTLPGSTKAVALPPLTA